MVIKLSQPVVYLGRKEFPLGLDSGIPPDAPMLLRLSMKLIATLHPSFFGRAMFLHAS
jgi:hypothetical protein